MTQLYMVSYACAATDGGWVPWLVGSVGWTVGLGLVLLMCVKIADKLAKRKSDAQLNSQPSRQFNQQANAQFNEQAKAQSDPSTFPNFPIGGGDFKLILAFAAIFQDGVLLVLLVSCVAAAVVALIAQQNTFAFGPYLALSGVIKMILMLVGI